MKIIALLWTLSFAFCTAKDAIARQASFDVQGALDAQQDEVSLVHGYPFDLKGAVLTVASFMCF